MGNGMRRVVWLLLVAVVAAWSCGGGEREQAMRIALLQDSLESIIEAKEAELNDVVGTMNEILAGFEEINLAEGRIVKNADDVERDRSGEIEENMNFIRRTLAVNKERIALLESQLAASGAKSSKLAATIDNLNRQLEAKQSEIAELEAELREKEILLSEQSSDIADLQQTQTELIGEGQRARATIEAQDRDLHRGWYVFGTKKELKSQRILDDGEVLTQGSYNEAYFTEVDTRQLTELKLYSKGAKLLTSHPEGSYVLARDAQKEYVLRITDAERFWSVSRYLVIQVK